MTQIATNSSMGHSRTGDIAGQQGLQIAGTPEQRRQVKPGRKNWITRNVWESIYFKRGIALSGYHFDFPTSSNGISSNSTEVFTSIMRLTNSVTLDTVRQNRGYCRSKRLKQQGYGRIQIYQDRKVTSWERDYFSVKADSYEEAEAIVRSWNCEDVSNIIDNRLCYEEWQALTDTSESMLPEENDGNPTIEISIKTENQ